MRTCVLCICVSKGEATHTTTLEYSYYGNCYNYEYDGFVFVDEMGERLKVNYLSCVFMNFLDYSSKITSAQSMETGLELPESGNFTSKWEIADNMFLHLVCV
ncbi:MAG: hypothetical protein KIG53_04985 [Oscillospiraceae bacterium]|nr:hypothetical protein [Oscillospiraceae bacterium]